MKFILFACLVLAAGDPADSEIVAARVAAGPKIDGVPDDACWKSAKEYVIKVDFPVNLDDPKEQISLKVVHDGERVYFLMVWKDEKEHRLHHPWVWSEEKKAYEEPYTAEEEDCEDSASIAFELEGKFDPDMLAGVESKWDVWVWQAGRSDPVGYAKDKRHIFTLKKPGEGKFAKRKTEDGRDLWLGRPEDKGRSVTAQLDPPKSKGDEKVARYKAQEPDGSAADVRAKGTWEKGAWRVEFSRALKTGHDDDTAFDAGKSYAFAVAAFDHSELMGHTVSGALKLTFGK